MSVLSNKDRLKMKSMLGKCLEGGKLNSGKVDFILEEAALFGYERCELMQEEELQALEGRRRERLKKEEEES